MRDRAAMERDTADVKALLLASIDRLAAELAPEGRRQGGYWVAKNPTRADRSAGSFWVHLTGKPGAWTDAATGDKGDVFGLIAYVLGHAEFKDTIRWAKGWLGLADMPERDRARQVAKARQYVEDTSGVDDAEKAKKAFGLFVAAKQRPFLGSPADLYLQGRSIDVRALGRMPGSIGWLPDCWCGFTRSKLPAMIAGFSNDAGAIVAVHRTYLAEERGQWVKAPIYIDGEQKARSIWPSYRGAAIRLWRGASKLAVAEADAAFDAHGVFEQLALVEGVEDGLSLALARPDLRIWAAGSLGNLGAISIPRCVDEVIVCADNDWSKLEAQKALGRAVDHIMAQDKTVSIARAHIGKDVNDQLRGTAA